MTSHSSTIPVADDLRRQMAALLPNMRAYARFLVRGQGEADDLVQDSILRALNALDQFQPGTNLKGWLLTILRNVFFEQVRRRKREQAALQRGGAAQDTVGPQQLAHQAVGDLQRQLWLLPPLLREALVLVGAQELSYEEAAAICDVPLGTMKARVSRARSKLEESNDLLDRQSSDRTT